MTYHFRTVESDWVGPKSNIWGDDQCSDLGALDDSYNLDACKQACLIQEGCNAINLYNAGNDGQYCTLRNCSIPIPEPTYVYADAEGYYLENGTICFIEYAADLYK